MPRNRFVAYHDKYCSETDSPLPLLNTIAPEGTAGAKPYCETQDA